MPQTISVFGPNLRDQSKGQFHVHATGCADIKRNRNLRDADLPYVFEADSATQVVDAIYPPEDFDCESGEYIDEFYFAPCVHLEGLR